MLVIAHRTPASAGECRRLAAAGASVFELDVQLVRGELVVSHYVPLPLLPGWQRDNWRVRPPGGRDPALRDRAGVVPPGATVLLDLKARSTADRRALAEAIIDALPDRDRYRVSGIAGGDLDTLRAAGFGTWRSVGDRRSLAATLARAPLVGELTDEAVTMRHSLVTRPVVEQLQTAGTRVMAWTVNSIRRAGELVDLGVDGITTDSAAVARAVSGAG